MELEITWNRAIKVWLSLLWRNAIAIIAAILIGALVGGIVGGVLGAAGVSIENIQVISSILGFILGLAISIVPVKLVLGKDFGEFRLVLLAGASE